MPDETDGQEIEGQTGAEEAGTATATPEDEGGESAPRLEETLAQAGAEIEEMSPAAEAEQPEASEETAPTEGEEPGTEPSAEAEEPEAEGEHAPAHVRWSADNDPEGTYRDAQGRLHDAESGDFLEGETKEPPAAVQEVAEQDLTEDEVEEFWEGQEEEERPEPIELEVEGEEGETERLALDVADEETREVLEDRLERAERASELEEEVENYREREAEVQAAQEELRAIEEGIKQDPSGFILQRLDAAGETRRSLAEDLLLDDDVWEGIANTVENWRMNPHERKVAKAERKAELAERQAEHVEGRTRRERGQKILDRLTAMVPEDLDRGDPDRLIDRVIREIEQAVAQDESLAESVNEENFTEIEGVRELLSVYGVDPDRAANGADRESGSESEVVEAEPAGEQERDLKERAEVARRTGVRLRKMRERKEDAGQTTPAGAGASPSSGELPSDATLDDAIEHADRRVG